MHFKLPPVRPDKLTERVSIPSLRPGQKIGSHAAIVPEDFRGRAAPFGRPPVSTWVTDVDAGTAPARTERT